MSCLQWKFHTSDTNADGVLGGRELFPTLRAVRRHYGDKRCLRKVIKFCDTNKDRKVTMNEWITCMRPTAGINSSKAFDNDDCSSHIHMNVYMNI